MIFSLIDWLQMKRHIIKAFFFSDFDILRKKGYENSLPSGACTNISNTNPNGSKTYDHIWIPRSTASIASGISLVLK